MTRRWVVLLVAATCLLGWTAVQADDETPTVSAGSAGVGVSADSVVIAIPLPSPDPFPLAVGMTWTYGGSPMEMARTIRIPDAREAEDGAIYLWEGVQGTHAVRKADGGKVMELRGETWGLLFDLGAEEGASWTIEGADNLMEGTVVTVVSRSAEVSVPYGRFDACVYLKLAPDPGLRDAGVLGMWFAPGVGLVKWEELTFAGAQTYELANFAYRWEPQDSTVIGPSDSTMAQLTGEVVDDEGMPIVGAMVSLRPQSEAWISAVSTVMEAWTSRSGLFTLYGIAPGDYVLAASKEGYDPVAMPVTLNAGFNRVSVGLKQDQEGFQNVHITEQKGLLAELATDRQMYASGDLVQVRYRLTNVSGETLTLRFGSGQRYDLTLEGQNGRVWAWSELMDFAQVPGEAQLAPEKTFEFRESVTLRDEWAVSGASYLLRGFLTVTPAEDGSVAPAATEASVKFAVDGEIPNADPEIPKARLAVGVRTNRDVYAPGDSVVVGYYLTNISDEAITLKFASGQRYDLALTGPDDEIWRWSSQRSFDQAAGQVILAPEETFGFREALTLSQMGADAPGGYALRAFMTMAPEDSTDVSIVETEAWVKFIVDTGSPPINPYPGPLPVERRISPELETEFTASGDSVRVIYRLINTAEDAMRLMYRSGQQYDLVLEGLEGEVWRWSEGRGFHDALWEQTLTPGDTLAVHEAFAMPDLSEAEGKTYVLTGFLAVTPDAPEAVSPEETQTRLKFTVQSEGNMKVEALTHLTDDAGGQSRAADFNSDGAVNFADFLQFAKAFGKMSDMPGYDLAFDLDGDDTVGFADFLLFASSFGK